MKKALLLFSVCLFLYTANACLNEYHVNKKGAETIDHFSMGHLYFIRNFDTVDLNHELTELLKDTVTNQQSILYNRNDIAVHYIKLGRYNEAKILLEELLKQYPNEYNVNVNLGTLYELMGENTKALTFIKKAITLNTESHTGSEWFHVKVLLYKLKNRNDQQMTGNIILDLYKSKIPADKLIEDVAYQLHERIPFTPLPNLMMAKILLEYGDYMADSISIEGAYVVYQIAEEYDAGKVLPLAKKRNDLLPIFEKFRSKVKVPDYKDYFVTSEEANARQKAGKETKNLLEEGIKKIFGTEEKEESRGWSPIKTTIVIATVVLLAFLVFLFVRSRR